MPRKKRSFGHRLQERRASAPAVLCVSSNRPSKRKSWTSDEMLAAMSAVKDGMLVKAAAEAHGVPVSQRESCSWYETWS